jgi:hypothetical protein
MIFKIFLMKLDNGKLQLIIVIFCCFCFIVESKGIDNKFYSVLFFIFCCKAPLQLLQPSMNVVFR